MSERAKKAADLQEKIASIDLYLNDLQTKRDELKRELKLADRAMEIDDIVEIEKTCRQGCCVEFQFTGRVIAVDDKGWYELRSSDGKTYKAAPHEGSRVKK